MQEFDDPTIQATVHAMIANEMRSFQPGNYLAYLPLPELTFSKSTALQVINFVLFVCCLSSNLIYWYVIILISFSLLLININQIHMIVIILFCNNIDSIYYVSYIYRHLALTTPSLFSIQAEMARLESAPSSSSAKLEMDRYMAERPQKQDEKSEQVVI